MVGVCGWFGRIDGDPARTLGAMLGGQGAGASPSIQRRTDAGLGIGAQGPPDLAWITDVDGIGVAVCGHPRWIGSADDSAQGRDIARRLVAEYRNRGVDEALRSLDGDFALALIDERERRVVLAVDRTGIRNLVYAFESGTLVFGPTCDSVGAHPAIRKRVRAQALYDYVYFHMVPGPETVFEGQTRMLPGHCVVLENGRFCSHAYWRMPWVESGRREFADLKRGFRSALERGVAVMAADAECGTFLSGGTDSSTVTGLLGHLTGRPPRSFSIGFDAKGFDEMAYARIAARHFGSQHFEYYVTPADTLAAVPLIAEVYDQPFGNASAVPVYYCAKLAKGHGISRMLAGDGGDELFGGNARYARQHQLALYDRIPASLRRLVVEPLVVGTSLFSRGALLRRARSYVEQARMPMPARYESYNLLERIGPSEVFDADFLATVDQRAPVSMLDRVYLATGAKSLINRLLEIDLRFTLADNDLPKVTRMCEAAGVDVAFPLLQTPVVEFSASLPPDHKLRGTQLRWFFKEALRDFLPAEVIAKQKHGFGLPAGLWLREYPPLRDLGGDALSSLRSRHMFRGEFLDALTGTRIHEHAGYYGTMVWILMMLELWFRKHAP